MNFFHNKKSNFIVPGRLIYENPGENPDQKVESQKATPEDGNEAQAKFFQAVNKFRKTLSQYKNNSDKAIQAEVQSAEDELRRAEMQPNLTETERERITISIEARIAFFAARDIEASKKYVEDEVAFTLKELDQEIVKLLPIFETEENTKPRMEALMRLLLQGQTLEGARARYDFLTKHITQLENGVPQNNILTALNLLSAPEDVSRRALVLATLKDQLKEITTGIYDNANFRAMEELTEAPADFIAVSLHDTEAVGERQQDLKLIDAIKKETILAADTEFRLSGGVGIKLKDLSSQTKILLVNSEVYSAVDDEGQIHTYVKVQIDPPNGPIGFIPSDSFQYVKEEGNNETEGIEKNDLSEVEKKLRTPKEIDKELFDYILSNEDYKSKIKSLVNQKYDIPSIMQAMRSDPKVQALKQEYAESAQAALARGENDIESEARINTYVDVCIANKISKDAKELAIIETAEHLKKKYPNQEAFKKIWSKKIIASGEADYSVEERLATPPEYLYGEAAPFFIEGDPYFEAAEGNSQKYGDEWDKLNKLPQSALEEEDEEN